MEFDKIHVGARASVSRVVSDDDVRAFAHVTGDTNPVHIDEDFAARSYFKKRVVHGFLTASLIGTVLGTRLPGPGTIYLEQQLRFVAPVAVGARITAEVEVVEKINQKRRLRLRTTCRCDDGTVVLVGEALVMVPEPRA